MPVPTVYARPGVYTIEVPGAPTPIQSPTSPSTAGFIGEHWFGPANLAVRCNSWNDFQRVFGGFNTNLTPVLANGYLPYAVYMFFINGGNTAWVARSVASANPGSSAFTTFQDGSATPQNTLSLGVGHLGVPGNPGAWGNLMFADIVASPVAGRFAINLYKGAYAAANLVETWPDLSMVKTDARYALAIINSGYSGSNFVVATDLGDTAAFPANMPKVVSGQQFAGGADSLDPAVADRVATVTVGTSPFDIVPGPLNFNLPGETAQLVTSAAITYATTRPSTFVVIDPPALETPAAVENYMALLSPIASNAALYYPWVTASNPASNNIQSTISLPPGALVLGQMSLMDTKQGPWRAPAGTTTVLAGIVGAERILSPADQGNLNSVNVNAIRTLANGQVIIWGARTLQSGFNTLYVNIRRTLNYIEAYLVAGLESQVFNPNDSSQWGVISNQVTSFLGNLLAAGAFASTVAAQAYFVICDDTNNTPQSIAQGILNVTVGVALANPAEFIVLTIQQFQSGGTTTTTVTQTAS